MEGSWMYAICLGTGSRGCIIDSLPLCLYMVRQAAAIHTGE